MFGAFWPGQLYSYKRPHIARLLHAVEVKTRQPLIISFQPRISSYKWV